MRILRAKLALDTGWTFDYIDQLDIEDIGDLVSFQAGQSKLAERHSG